MGIRVAIRENRTLTIVVLAVVLIGVLALWMMPEGDGSGARQAWFTDDDGKS